MIKQIIQQLLEHQTFVSSLILSVQLQQPVSAIEHELEALDQKYPDLLKLKYNDAGHPFRLFVRIAEGGEEMARKLLR